jgi:hypothetical protein
MEQRAISLAGVVAHFCGGWEVLDAVNQYLGELRPIREVAERSGIKKSTIEDNAKKIFDALERKGIRPNQLDPSYATRWRPIKKTSGKTGHGSVQSGK